ncbi:hypothetical protein ACHAXT_008146 [Thalassiosira profunda]
MTADSAEPPTAAATPPPAAPSGGGGGGLLQLARSMAGVAPPASNASQSAPVPDVLLSLAKDDRYVSEVSSLLSQVAVSLASVFLLPGGPSTSARTSRVSGGVPNREDVLEDDGQRFIERIRPELNLLASIVVHSATFVFYTRNFGECCRGERREHPAIVGDGIVEPSLSLSCAKGERLFEGKQQQRAIIANRPSYKPLAAMIMVQALAALAQTTAEASIEVAHFVQVSFFRWRRRRRMQQQVQTGAGSSHDENGPLLDRTTSSERAEYMELIEERVPGLASSNRDTPAIKAKRP